MSWQDLRGHTAIREMFQEAVRRHRLASGYLFLGPGGIGKRHFARLIAQSLFCERTGDDDLDACGTCSSCRQVQADTHPDLLTVACPPGKRELPIDLLVGARERRGREGLCHDLSMRAMTASRRVAIVDDADMLSEESTNALLKTLEEPLAGAILILLTRDLDPILPTIRSRCQLVRFSPLPDAEVADLIVQLGWETDSQRAAEVAAESGGSLDMARQLLNPEIELIKQAVLRAVEKLRSKPLDALRGVQEALEQLGGDTAQQREYAQWTIRLAIEAFRKRLREVDDVHELDKCAAMLERCAEADAHLRQSMPVALCFEALFDHFARIERDSITVP